MGVLLPFRPRPKPAPDIPAWEIEADMRVEEILRLSAKLDAIRERARLNRIFDLEAYKAERLP
jgi:hypothetical protein